LTALGGILEYVIHIVIQDFVNGRYRPTDDCLSATRQGLATRLDKAAKAMGVSKSEFIRQCLTDRLNRLDGVSKATSTAWEVGKDLFGCCASGRGELSIRAKEIARGRIRENFAKENRHRQRSDRRVD
jgi:hypothetical protein